MLRAQSMPGIVTTTIIATGSADNIAINAAIVQANSAGGGKVTLGPGVFDITSAILPLSNVWLCGSGEDVTTLKLHGGVAYADQANVIFAKASSSADLTNFTLSDFSINGNRANQTLGSTQDNAFNGICIRGSGTGFSCKDFKVRNITSYGCGYHGLAVYDGCIGFSIHDYTGHDNGFRGLHVHANDTYPTTDYNINNIESYANGVDTTTGLQTGQLSGVFTCLSSVSRGNVSNVTVRNEPGYAYEVDGLAGSDTVPADHVTYSNLKAYNCALGIRLSSTVTNVAFVNVCIKNMNTTSKGAGATGAGIYFTSAGTLGGDGVSFSNLTITDCSWWGILSDAATNKWKNLNFSNVIVKNCGTNTGVASGGINTNGMSNAVFSGLVIFGCNAGSAAPRQLYVQNGANITVMGFNIDSGTANFPSIETKNDASKVVLMNGYVNRNSGSGTGVTLGSSNSFIINVDLAGSNTVNNTGTANTCFRSNVDSTGAGTALLGTNSPASTPTAPYTWMSVTTKDGSLGYVPVWK